MPYLAVKKDPNNSFRQYIAHCSPYKNFHGGKFFVSECSRAHQHPKDAGGVTHHCVKSFRLVLATNAKVGFALEEKKSLGS